MWRLTSKLELLIGRDLQRVRHPASPLSSPRNVATANASKNFEDPFPPALCSQISGPHSVRFDRR